MMKKLDEAQDEPCKTVAQKLTHRQIRIARRIGQGNISEGIRRCIERAAADFEFMEALPKVPK